MPQRVPSQFFLKIHQYISFKSTNRYEYKIQSAILLLHDDGFQHYNFDDEAIHFCFKFEVKAPINELLTTRKNVCENCFVRNNGIADATFKSLVGVDGNLFET